MAEAYTGFAAGVATGSAKAILNLFNPAATPTTRGRIYEINLSSVATPADQAAKFAVNRTTAVGTEGGGFTPNNLDPAGPAGAYDVGQGTFSVQPTLTANKELLVVSVNQRAVYRWVANEGRELVMAATQNNGAAINCVSSTSTQAAEACVFWLE